MDQLTRRNPYEIVVTLSENAVLSLFADALAMGW